MMREVLRHGWDWILLGILVLAVLARQLRTGKVVTKGWGKTFLLIYRRDSRPRAFWTGVFLTGGIGILLIGYGISKVIER